MRLLGAVTKGSGAVNEDALGYAGTESDVRAAWVFDGVTGINGRNVLGAGTDAEWLVAKANQRLRDMASENLPLENILALLVAGLCEDFATARRDIELPLNYDPPAACLILAKRYGDGWKALRLGDSCLLSEGPDGKLFAARPEKGFDEWLAAEARKRRDAGILDVKALLAEFRPQLMASRSRRNRPGGYGILEADPVATGFAEYMDLGTPKRLLICTDGFYRAVDHYEMHDDRELIAACGKEDGVASVLKDLRAIEAGDPLCQRFLRFKPADDATAVMLGAETDEPRRL